MLIFEWRFPNRDFRVRRVYDLAGETGDSALRGHRVQLCCCFCHFPTKDVYWPVDSCFFLVRISPQNTKFEMLLYLSIDCGNEAFDSVLGLGIRSRNTRFETIGAKLRGQYGLEIERPISFEKYTRNS